MGYDVHITRKAQWFEPHGPEISADEWASYVDTHGECHWEPPAGREHEIDDAVLIVDSLDLEVGRVWWNGGEIRTKNPSPELMAYMIEVADTLDARLMGDESETYRNADSPTISRAPYFNANNLTNEWEEPPEGHEEAYRQQERERWAAYDAAITKSPPAKKATPPATAADLEKKAARFNRLSVGAAVLFLLIVAMKAIN
jgi:hypothetical protein